MELKRMGPSEIESLPQAFAFIDELLVIMAQQQERIVALEAEGKRLQDQQKLDSHNRSLPPSTDKGRQKRPSSQSLRQKSGRQPGGQHGHKGARAHKLIVQITSSSPRCRSAPGVDTMSLRFRQAGLKSGKCVTFLL
jgi:hypothetical protein